MTRTIRRLAGGVSIALLTAAGATTSAHAATAPPWEPDGSSQGGLTFYSAAGKVITGGTISSAPIAAYVVGDTALRSGDTKATLYGYLPVKGSPGKWSGEEADFATTYPNSGAPSGVGSTLPVVSGAATDESLATLEADYPNEGTGAYAGIYQLRLVTSGAGESVTSTYDSADIQISGSTWSVVYSGGTVSSGATATHTTLSVSASKLKHGKKLTLKVKETPAVAGKVKFFAGSKKLATVVAKKGKATYTTKTLKIGKHKLSAVFTPSNTTKDKPSTSKTVSVKITKT